MAQYSINDLSRMTGVKAHTIRAWEKRYGLFNPTRCMLNIRSYEEKDLELLKCIAVLRDNGKKIGDIAEMTNDEIDHESICCCKRRVACSDHDDLITNVIQKLDSKNLEKWLDQKFVEIGVEPAMVFEVFPLQNKLKLKQMTGQISQIKCDFVDQIVVRKLSVEINKEQKDLTNKKSALLFMPQAENHTSCNSFLHLLLLSRGYTTLNIGSTYNLIEIKELENSHSTFDMILTVLTEKFNVASAPDFIHDLSEIFPKSKIVVSGYQTKMLPKTCNGNLEIIEKVKDLINIK